MCRSCVIPGGEVWCSAVSVSERATATSRSKARLGSEQGQLSMRELRFSRRLTRPRRTPAPTAPDRPE